MPPKTQPSKGSPSWGRNTGKDLKSIIEVSFLFFFAPAIVMYYFMACDSFDCSLSTPALQLVQGQLSLSGFLSYAFLKIIANMTRKVPSVTSEATYLLFSWVFFQAALYLWLPGPKGHGQETPAGHVLEYNLNGLNSWILSHILFGLGVYFGYFPASIIYDNWGPLLVLANILGFGLAIFAYIKALTFPTHPQDNKYSGTWIYDFFMGVEMNPRLGNFDFKLFFNGRPGIGGWNLINLSFMAAQYARFGYVTNSMIIVTLLHMLYILDFFFNEDWYLKTIDIAHDHYGWYLAWGDAVWLPWMYTLQGFYLATHPVDMSNTHLAAVLFLAAIGYYIFRDSNDQRHKFRKNPSAPIWGKPPRYIKASYKTADGKEHQSHLLTSGYWGLSRHFNYFGDLIFSFSSCFACGFDHFLPYFYFLNMTILLLWRIERDCGRCKAKYGPKWDEYCKAVPYKLIPYIY